MAPAASPPSASSTSSSPSSSPSRRSCLQKKAWHLPLLALFLASCAPAPTNGLLPPFASIDVVDENNLREGQPQPLSFPDVALLMHRLQQEDDLKKAGKAESLQESLSDKEEARFISITDGGTYRGDLVVYLPITILLPTFALRSRYSMAGKRRENSLYDWANFLLGGSQDGRSLFADQEPNANHIYSDIRGPVDRVLTDQVRYDPDLFEYKTDPNFGPLLSRVDAYFHYLKVHDDDCRMRTICHLAQQPEDYSPLSYLILSALKKSESFSRPSVYNPHVFRFLRYYWAAERGVANTRCDHAYYRCPADLEDILNLQVLKFWQNLASVVSIKLSDE